ncbi:MAG: DNA polymerase III subunit beta [Streptosporangiaceae bacterium]
MKFRVGRDDLGEAVAFVSRALPSRPVVPLLSGMLLRADADGLTLSCFDYEVSARIRVDADVLESGTALVPGRLLAEITRSLPIRPAEFADDGDAVALTCGRAEFGLVCLPVQDYPPLPESPPPLGTVGSGLLAAAVAQVAPSASRDDTLPMLTAVCLDIDGTVMTLAATDRYRLAAREVRFDPAAPDLRAVALVPARVLAETARALSAGPEVAMAFDAGDGGRAGGSGGAGTAADQPRPADGLISFESADRRITTRLIAGEFIRYRTRFPDQFGSRAEFPAGPVIDAVRRASLVAERAGPVRLSFGSRRVVIEAHAEGRARAAESVPAEFAGDCQVISFNPHYLLDGLVAAAATAVDEPGPAGDQAKPGDRERPARAAKDEPAGGDDGSSSGPAPAGTGETVDGDDAAGGRIRLEFNTSAKPALITRVGDDGLDGGPGPAGPAGSAGPDDTAGSAGPDDTAGSAGPDDRAGSDREAGSGAEEARDDAGAAFRYLLVPLRVPDRA